MPSLILILLVPFSVLSLLPVSCAGSYDLFLNAELENVQRIGLPYDHTFFLRLRCLNCHEEPPRAVAVSHAMDSEGVRGSSVNVQVNQMPLPLPLLPRSRVAKFNPVNIPAHGHG
jgi:hypothetical protein